MTEPEVARKPRWPICGTTGCIGVRVGDQEACLAHVDLQTRKTTLAALRPGSDLDLRGTSIDPELLSQLLAALRPEDGPPTLGNVRFDRAQFNGTARFSRTQFNGTASFNEAQFSDDTDFGGASFIGEARFIAAQFNGEALFQEAQFSTLTEFGRAQFNGHARFSKTQFNGTAEFSKTQFNGYAGFDETRFIGETWFNEAQFSGGGFVAAGFVAAQFNRNAWFKEARFSGNADFSGAQFTGGWFGGARFSSDARFRKVRFSRNAWFKETRFIGESGFDEAQFNEEAWFNKAEFKWKAGFPKAQFHGTAEFDEAGFYGTAGFNEAQFHGAASFNEAWLNDASFNEASFNGLAQFSRTQFYGTAKFYRTQFKRAGTFGPVLAASSLILDRATFEHDILIEAVGSVLVCTASRFAEAATLRLRYAQVVLDGTVFAKPSTIAFAPNPFKRYDPATGAEVQVFDESSAARAEDGWSPQPRLLSLRGLDVATLTLSELDLAACLFQGAHHLDELRIEGARPFADTPAAWRLCLGPWRVPVWRRWSRRQTLAEEHHWRSEPQPVSQPEPGRWLRLIQPDWYGPLCQTPSLVTEVTGQQVQRLNPDRLAVLYRALRKAQEDSKNEPGAADFYYGEMEMRRRDRRTPFAERVILWLYWLVSGYGLRGLRALACLVAVVVGLAVLLQSIGFNDGDPGFRDALIYAAQSTISIASGNKVLTEHVSWTGEVLRIALRLIGPVLLGLALLSVRNRVKR
jgi:Pentapeptide repeats (9 copies)